MSVPQHARWDDPRRAGNAGRELQIVNGDPRYSRVALVEPTTLGYVYVAGRGTSRDQRSTDHARSDEAYSG
jgi:hypothetical protein